ncbi:hypothetical protein [Microbacterium paulum]|nr:hypothetical protein [Microbacterium sp.]
MHTRVALPVVALFVAAAALLGGCSASTPASSEASVASSPEQTAGSTPAATADVNAETGDCIPADVQSAGIPIVSGTVVCELVRGQLADGTLSIVVQVASTDAGFTAATDALEQAGYTSGIKLSDTATYTNGTYDVMLTSTEQAPYGAVITYVIAPE